MSHFPELELTDEQSAELGEYLTQFLPAGLVTELPPRLFQEIQTLVAKKIYDINKVIGEAIVQLGMREAPPCLTIHNMPMLDVLPSPPKENSRTLKGREPIISDLLALGVAMILGGRVSPVHHGLTFDDIADTYREPGSLSRGSNMHNHGDLFFTLRYLLNEPDIPTIVADIDDFVRQCGGEGAETIKELAKKQFLRASGGQQYAILEKGPGGFRLSEGVRLSDDGNNANIFCIDRKAKPALGAFLQWVRSPENHYEVPSSPGVFNIIDGLTLHCGKSYVISGDKRRWASRMEMAAEVKKPKLRDLIGKKPEATIIPAEVDEQDVLRQIEKLAAERGKGGRAI